MCCFLATFDCVLCVSKMQNNDFKWVQYGTFDELTDSISTFILISSHIESTTANGQTAEPGVSVLFDINRYFPRQMPNN